MDLLSTLRILYNNNHISVVTGNSSYGSIPSRLLSIFPLTPELGFSVIAVHDLTSWNELWN